MGDNYHSLSIDKAFACFSDLLRRKQQILFFQKVLDLKAGAHDFPLVQLV